MIKPESIKRILRNYWKVSGGWEVGEGKMERGMGKLERGKGSWGGGGSMIFINRGLSTKISKSIFTYLAIYAHLSF